MSSNNVFRCKKCGLSLFKSDHLLSHDSNQQKSKTNISNSSNKNECTSFFVSQISWMKNCSEQKGRILCPNNNCDAKLGYYCWFGEKCSCGFWQTPAFQIHKSRVDYLPDSKKYTSFGINALE